MKHSPTYDRHKSIASDGETPLMRQLIGIEADPNEEILLQLISAGAIINIRNDEGNSAKDYAKEHAPELIKLF